LWIFWAATNHLAAMRFVLVKSINNHEMVPRRIGASCDCRSVFGQIIKTFFEKSFLSQLNLRGFQRGVGKTSEDLAIKKS